MSSRGGYGRPMWFEMNVTELDDTKVMLMMSQLGLEGYGIHVMLRAFLSQQLGYKAPLSIVPALATRYATTQAKIEAVIKGYDLYTIIEDSGNLFFSPELSFKLEKFDKKCLENKQKGELSATKKELEREEKIRKLQLTLSDLDSIQPQLNNGSTEYKERKEKKESFNVENLQTYIGKKVEGKNVIEDISISGERSILVITNAGEYRFPNFETLNNQLQN